MTFYPSCTDLKPIYFAPIIFFNVKAIIFKDEVHKIEILSCYSSISKYSSNTRILRVSTSLLHAIAATKICTIPVCYLVAISGTTTICALATSLDKYHQALLAMGRIKSVNKFTSCNCSYKDLYNPSLLSCSHVWHHNHLCSCNLT